MKKLALYISILSTTLFVSCSSDDNAVDTQKPEITLLEPGDHEGFLPGGEIHIEGLITDNEALASYKIEIHAAEDGHTHGRRSTNYFQYEQTFQITENTKVYELHRHVEIPENINGETLTNGHYHLGIFALDKAGNQQQVFTEIYIGNDAEEHTHG